MKEMVDRRWLMLLAVLVEGGLGLAACIVGWLLGVHPWGRATWSGAEASLGVAATGPMLVVFLLCLIVPLKPLRRIRRFADEVIRPLFLPCTLLDLAVICALAGWGEEMLFRGLLQPLLGEYLGTWAGVVATSLLFGLFHPISLAYFVLATAFGLYLGAIVLLREGLLAVMVAHGLYDFIALVYVVRWQRPPQSPQVGATEPSHAEA